MRKGLVLGKFMPIHTGHVNLINYALSVCDIVVVWVCVSNKETMNGDIRLNWVKEIFKDNKRIQPLLFNYDESILPSTSESSQSVSKVWAEAIKENIPDVNVIVSSEKYGDYLATYLNIEHCYYAIPKEVSATDIRENPYKNKDFIPEVVKPYYQRKICILGTESTGKSTLVENLAAHFQADFVPEVGREVVEHSNECTPNDLKIIATKHAELIMEKENKSSGLLFVDTDIHITKSYAKFLFDEVLDVEDWIMKANCCDLYLYLDNDVPYVQDGTRLSEADRNTLDTYHQQELEKAGISFIHINGHWDERFAMAVREVEKCMKGLNSNG